MFFNHSETRKMMLSTARGVVRASALPLPVEGVEMLSGLNFIQTAERYGRYARHMADTGADALFCGPLRSLGACRAVLIGACRANLPVHVAMRIAEDGYSPFGSDPLAAMLTAQALGAASFGFGEGGEESEKALARLAPFSVGTRLSAFPQDRQEARRFAASGADILIGGEWDASVFSMEKQIRHGTDEEGILAACDCGVFRLSESFEFSDPVECQSDMSEQILRAEDEGQDVLLIQVRTVDDAYAFSSNALMARLPVAFVSDCEEALEMALALFHGLAIIDSRCDLPRDTLERLACGYGATVI